MLSLFFEKCKVKSKCFHSFSRSEKWNQNASRSRSRSENSREFLTILEKRDFLTDLFRESQIRLLKQMACSWGINHEHLICPTINMLCSTYYCKIMFLCRNNPEGCQNGSNCRIWQIWFWNNIFIRSKSDHYIALSVSQFQTWLMWLWYAKMPTENLSMWMRNVLTTVW